MPFGSSKCNGTCLRTVTDAVASVCFSPRVINSRRYLIPYYTSPTPTQSNISLYRLEKQKRIHCRGSRGARRRVVEEAEELVLAPPPARASTRTPRSGRLLVNASRRASSSLSNTFSRAPLQICPRRGSRTRPSRPPLP